MPCRSLALPPSGGLSYWRVAKRTAAPVAIARTLSQGVPMAVAKNEAKNSPSAEPATPVANFSKDEELSAYRTMLTIRRFEEKAGQMYGMGLIGGFCHLYIGQEAVVVGMQMALKA